MNLKTLSALYLTILGVLLIAITVVTIFKADNQRALTVGHELRYESYLLADELRQSSDDLTRLARTYVITGDSRFEEQYWDVLAIRNGEKPRPLDYERIYWDLVINGEKPRANDKTIALQALMIELGFSEQEFAKLSEAQANSDGLVELETIAMNAVKGLFQDSAGGFTRTAEPDFAMARELMHSLEYHQNKAQIMRPVDEFFALLNERTESIVKSHLEKEEKYLDALKVLVSMTVLMFLLGVYSLKRRVLAPVDRLSTALSAIAEWH